MADPAPGTLTLHQAAAMVGTYRWTEERLFALTGQWSGEGTMSPPVQVELFGASRRHARRAEEWAQRLPVLAGVDPDALTRPAGAAGPLLTALAAEVGAPARLAGLCRVVLPALAATYRRHLARAVPVADGPLIRVLRGAVPDVEGERTAGAVRLAGLLDGQGGGAAEGPDGRPAVVTEGATAAREATALVVRLERLLAEEGSDGCLLAWPAAWPATSSA